MTDIDELTESTTVLLDDDFDEPSDDFVQPLLFVCFEHEIMEFSLAGKQLMGRPSKDRVPDIPVSNKYVSRDHGTFDTSDGRVIYTPSDSRNGTLLGSRRLIPGEAVQLKDGDELVIPASSKTKDEDIMLVCALSRSRINIWRGLMASSRDTLTSLPLRNTFRTWYLMQHSWNRESDICLFLLDIDKFKTINDTYGHSAGDKALKTLADELLATAGDTGYICRWGGDEFAGILAGSVDSVKKKLDEMRARIGKIKIDDKFTMTISAGVMDVQDVEGVKEIDRLIAIADKALYKAKENGRDRVCVARIQKRNDE
ncbi:MAG: GGDEF domain-containing protein [Lachnospiraceae bacterium]|nr:GGDEF domain-containing protein [Lachnospiraceae bacterium]